MHVAVQVNPNTLAPWDTGSCVRLTCTWLDKVSRTLYKPYRTKHCGDVPSEVLCRRLPGYESPVTINIHISTRDSETTVI